MNAYTQSYGHIRDAAKKAGWWAASFVEYHDKMKLSVLCLRDRLEPHCIITVNVEDHPFDQHKQVYTTLRMRG